MPGSNLKTSIAKGKRLATKVLADHRWAHYYLQRRVCNPVHRQAVAFAIAAFLPKAKPRKRADSETTRLAEKLGKDGFAVPPDLLSLPQVNDITGYLSQKFCYDPNRPARKGFKDPRDAHSSCLNAYYRPADLLASPHVLNLANHPTVLRVMETVFGAKPTISKIQAWWLMHGFDELANQDNASVTNPMEFHRDGDDWAAFKLFVYLTDVDETAGPHQFLRGSHLWRLGGARRSLDLRDRSMAATQDLQMVTGAAGFGWLENTYCLHRGMIPLKKNRLILSVTYSLFSTPLWSDNPRVPLDTDRFDPYINRVYLARAPGMAIR